MLLSTHIFRILPIFLFHALSFRQTLICTVFKYAYWGRTFLPAAGLALSWPPGRCIYPHSLCCTLAWQTTNTASHWHSRHQWLLIPLIPWPYSCPGLCCPPGLPEGWAGSGRSLGDQSCFLRPRAEVSLFVLSGLELQVRWGGNCCCYRLKNLTMTASARLD